MTTRREQLEQRWHEVAAELQAITSSRLIPDQAFPDDREAELLEEQDRIEWQLGELGRLTSAGLQNDPFPESEN